MKNHKQVIMTFYTGKKKEDFGVYYILFHLAVSISHKFKAGIKKNIEQLNTANNFCVMTYDKLSVCR